MTSRLIRGDDAVLIMMNGVGAVSAAIEEASVQNELTTRYCHK